jgi:mono/diheme cytochrome c family protein
LRAPSKSDWHEKYREQYKKAKEEGESFYPYAIIKDAVAALVVFVALVLVAILLGAHLEEIADPTTTTYNPRPEWYFLFLFQLLKYFPGSLEPVAVVVLPTLVILGLFLLPFLDRGPFRHPLNRPLATGAGVLAVVGIIVLTILGVMSPLTTPPSEEGPQVIEGKRLYRELRCAYCHSIRDVGGSMGPALDNEGSRRDMAWLQGYLKDPQSKIPGSRMPRPKFGLMEDEIAQLSAYLFSLRAPEAVAGPVSFSKDVLPIFQKACVACHGTLGGLNLESYGSTMSTGANKPVVIPGNADESLLVKRLKGEGGSIMPPTGALPAGDIGKIIKWVKDGAKND